jgi:hypothetical protein
VRRVDERAGRVAEFFLRDVAEGIELGVLPEDAVGVDDVADAVLVIAKEPKDAVG